MATVASLLVKLRADGSDLTEGLNEGGSRLRRFSEGAVKASRAVVGGAALVATAMAGVGIASIKMAANMEQTEVAFTTLLGDTETAKAFLADLSEFAAKTPFELPGLQRSSRQLLAFGFEAGEILPIMTDVGDAISALGGGEAEISRVVNALGQMQAKGKTSREELLQIAELGIPVFDILKDQFQLTGEQLDKSISSGAIEVDKTIEALLKGMENRFEGSMDAQSKTINGSFSNIKDNVGQIMVALGSEIIEAINLGPILKNVGEFLSEFRGNVQASGIRKALSDLIPPGLKDVIIVLAGAIAGPLVVGLGSAALAALAFVASLLPFILIGAAIAGIALLIKKNWEKIAPVIEPLIDRFKEFASDVSDRVNEFIEFLKAIDWEAVLVTFVDALRNLRMRIQPIIDFLKNLWASIKAAWDIVLPVIIGIFTQLQNSFAVLLENVTPIWESLKGLFVTLGETFQAVWAVLEPLVVAVGAVFVTAFGLVVGAVNGVIQALGPFIDFIINMVTIVLDIIKFFAQVLTGDWDAAWETVISIGENALKAIENALETIGNLVSGFVDGVVGFFTSLWKSLVGGSIVSDIVTGLISGFTNMKDRGIEIVKDLVSGLLNKIGGLPGKLLQKGKDMASNLWNGFKNKLGISSPSFIERAFIAMEESANKSFRGIRQMVPRFNETIGSLAMPAMNISAASAGANGVGVSPGAAETSQLAMPGGIIIQIENLNVREEADIERISEGLFKLQQDRLRRRGFDV